MQAMMAADAIPMAARPTMGYRSRTYTGSNNRQVKNAIPA
jgi:hypothetical protein